MTCSLKKKIYNKKWANMEKKTTIVLNIIYEKNYIFKDTKLKNNNFINIVQAKLMVIVRP